MSWETAQWAAWPDRFERAEREPLVSAFIPPVVPRVGPDGGGWTGASAHRVEVDIEGRVHELFGLPRGLGCRLGDAVRDREEAR